MSSTSPLLLLLKVEGVGGGGQPPVLRIQHWDEAASSAELPKFKCQMERDHGEHCRWCERWVRGGVTIFSSDAGLVQQYQRRGWK